MLAHRTSLGLITLAVLAGVSLARADVPRAIWVWEGDATAIVDDPAERDAAIAFFERKGIDVVYLYADRFQGRNPIADEPAKIAAVVRAMRARGLEVYALLGSSWLKTQRYARATERAEAVAMVGRVLAYQRGREEAERFAGISLDIEPYLLPEWDEQKAVLGASLVDLFAIYAGMVRGSGESLVLEAAIPFWFDGVSVSWGERERPLSEHLQDVLDRVVIMDYRDRAEGSDGIIAHASKELRHADGLGKKVVVGLETDESSPTKVTFLEEGEAVLEREMAIAAKAFEAHPSFAGFAIHHYGHYRGWAR